MEYLIIARSAAGIMPDWGRAASELAAEVNLAMQAGWRPLGGVCSCHTGSVLMQSMIREAVVATEARS